MAEQTLDKHDRTNDEEEMPIAIKKGKKAPLKSGFVNNNKRFTQAKKGKKDGALSERAKLLIALFAFLTVNLTAILLFVFDAGNIRTSLVSLINPPQGTKVSYTSLQEERKALESSRQELEQQKQELEKTRLEIQDKEAQLNQREQELNQREQELQAREEGNASRANAAAAAAAPASGEASGDLAKIVKIYESMEPENAARILSSLDMKSRVAVIRNMNQSKAAEILAQMAPKDSAGITAALMKE